MDGEEEEEKFGGREWTNAPEEIEGKEKKEEEEETFLGWEWTND